MRATRLAFFFLALTVLVAAVDRGAARAVSCDTFDQCMTGGTCQPDGSCEGTPRANGFGCDDGNPCTKNDSCQAGNCMGVPDMAMNDKVCDSGLGLCAPQAKCFVVEIPGGGGFAFCNPGQVTQCDQTGLDQCTFNVCNPQTGQCQVFSNPCFGECGSCDPSTGDCTANPKQNGAQCDDFNDCTSGDNCQAGNCVAGGGGGPTATQTVGANTPTRTRTSTVAANTPTRTPTPTVTLDLTRTATRTVTRTSTPSATPTKAAAACFGDCNGSGTLTASDLGRQNSTILRCGPCPGGIPGGVATGCASLAGGCPAADFNNDGCIRASELSRANQNILKYQPSGCGPTPTP